jgi:hypothetical protein
MALNTSALLPVGEAGKSKWEMISKGDVVKLVTGEEVTFMEMKRSKWVGRYNGKGIGVPLYRDHAQTKPFITAIVGRDESVIVKGIAPSKLKLGDLFSLEGHKETFMYFGDKITPRAGKKYLMGRDLSSGKNYTIEAGMKILKIDLNKLKKELISK